MKTVSFRRIAAGVGLFFLGVASTLVAQTVGDSAQRVELKRADLSGAPGMEVVASLSEYKKGDGIDLHIQHGVEAGYVVQGSMVQSPGSDPRPLPNGAHLLNLLDVKHGGFKVVGDTPLKLFTVHILNKGKPLYDYAK